MATAALTRTVRVLIVDDHPLIRAGVAMVLARDPRFEVVGEDVDTAQRALSEIARLRPDVVVLDLNLPDGNGVDICARLQAEFPRVRILVLTLSASDRTVITAFRSGAHGYAVKRADCESVLAGVRAVADDETYLDPRIAHVLVNHAIKGRRSRGPFGLTSQELHVLELVQLRLSNHDIACQLGLSVETVRSHLRHAMTKLGVEDRRSAIDVLVRNGLA